MHPLLSSQAQRVFLVLGAVLLRLLVGLSSYSGADIPPKYGDYEAQRHWMELTVNLPAYEWYNNSELNDPSYWPLDYPPLSGYQSKIHGLVLQHLEPFAVTLVKSRGYETPSSKLIMRMTVLFSDLLIYFPAALACAHVFTEGQGTSQYIFTLAALLLQPSLVLIDHGHFQYNCISLGFAAAAAAAIGSGHNLWGSLFFCLSLNHKQMSLFYAPAFFAHLLGRCLQQPTFLKKGAAVARLGLMVVATFVLLWVPCLSSPADVFKVLQRIFPVKRGLYEDYVSNFWCATSVAIKWRQLFTEPLLLKLSAGTTLAVACPAMIQQIRSPSPRGLLLCMANSAFAFYMFSYQVHEKSILLPLLPITTLAASQPGLAVWAPVVGAFSMYPLLVRDGVALTYVATCLGYITLLWPAYAELASATPRRNGKEEHKAVPGSQWLRLVWGWILQRQTLIGCCGLVLGCLLHVLRELIPAPKRYPWIHDRAFITASFSYFAAVAVYLQIQQWYSSTHHPSQASKQKLQ